MILTLSRFLDTTATASITGGAFVFFVDDFGRQETLVNTPPCVDPSNTCVSHSLIGRATTEH